MCVRVGVGIAPAPCVSRPPPIPPTYNRSASSLLSQFEGFRKILKKFDKKVGRKDQESVMANIRQFSFARREQMLEPSMETVKLYHSELVRIK